PCSRGSSARSLRRACRPGSRRRQGRRLTPPRPRLRRSGRVSSRRTSSRTSRTFSTEMTATGVESPRPADRSHITVDLRALRRNVTSLLRKLDGAELWAVVKADGYGHGAPDVAHAALDAGATALCVATVAEALSLRGDFRG